jgi:hypothetical protein
MQGAGGLNHRDLAGAIYLAVTGALAGGERVLFTINCYAGHAPPVPELTPEK